MCSAFSWRLVQRVPAAVGPYLKLAMSRMLMHCLERWLYEIAGFLAGIISEVELAAQSVMYQLAAASYVVTPSPQRSSTAIQRCLDRFHSRRADSQGLLWCCQTARWKCSWCWEDGASQAVQQGLPHPHTYELTTVCGLRFERRMCLFFLLVCFSFFSFWSWSKLLPVKREFFWGGSDPRFL